MRAGRPRSRKTHLTVADDQRPTKKHHRVSTMPNEQSAIGAEFAKPLIPGHIPASFPIKAALAGIAAVLAGVFYFVGRQPDLKSHVPEFIALSLAAGILYLGGVYLVQTFELGRAALVTILASALLFRLCLLPAQPQLSDDVYRYQWEGRVQRAHINPYHVFPALPSLRPLGDARHPLETGRTTPTVYPPLSEAAFSWVRTVAGYKQLFTALDLASIGLLLALLALERQPLQRILVYAWNPTVLTSFALCGHHDSLAILTLLAANV